MPKLIIIENNKERHFELEQKDVTIGRSGKSDIKLDDSKASRNHCKIVFSDLEGYSIEDLGSSNGTKVNGKPVKKEILAVGDKITIGAANIFFDQIISDDDLKIADDDLKIDLGEDKPAGTPAPAQAPPPQPTAATPEKETPRETKFLLVGLAGEVKGQEFPINDSLSIGRRKNNHIILKDEKVSGDHAVVHRQGDVYVLKDLGSTNGTWIGGRKATEEKLGHGSMFRMGKCVFAFKDRHIPLPDPREADLGEQDAALPSQEAFDSVAIDPALQNQGNIGAMVAGTLLTVAMIVILVAGFFVLKNVLDTEMPPTIEGNMIVENWSFDEPSSSGSLPSWEISSPDWSVDSGKTAHGPASLKLNAPGEALHSSESTFDSNSNLYFGAEIFITDEDTVGAVGLEFTNPTLPGYRETRWTPLAAKGHTGEFRRIEAAVVPPRSATKCRIACAHLSGSGSVFFDAVQLFEVPKSATENEQMDENVKRRIRLSREAEESSRTLSAGSRMDVDFTPGGLFSLWNKGVKLMWNGQIIVRESGDGLPATRQDVAQVSRPLAEREQSVYFLETKIQSAARKVKYRVEQTLTVGLDSITVDYELSVPSDPVSPLSISLVALTNEELFASATPAREELVWGNDREKVSLGFPSKTEPKTLQLEDGLLMVEIPVLDRISKKDVYSFQIVFSTRSRYEQKILKNDVEQVKQLWESGFLSDARKLAAEVARRAGTDTETSDRAEEIIRSIDGVEENLRGDLMNIKRDIETYRNPNILPIFRSLVTRTRKAFPDTLYPWARKTLVDLEETVKSGASRKDGEEAEVLLKAASMHYAEGRYNMAEAFYREVVARFPDTEEAKRASNRIKVIEARDKK